MARWIGSQEGLRTDRLADEHILSLCTGQPTLDLGCGPGRFTVALLQRNSAALGVDSSKLAVELTRQRGGAAIRRDLFDPLPGEGLWTQVLLADGNIGIGGDPVRTLRRAAGLLAPSGRVVAEVDPPPTAVDREIVRWESQHHRGSWFPWSRVGVGAMGELAHATGLQLGGVTEIHGRFIALLTKHAAMAPFAMP
jgi:SAM-dependent methyltransferase